MTIKSVLASCLIAISIFFEFNVNAQFALAVAKNDNGSSVKYSLKLAPSFDEAAKQAKKELEDLSQKNIFVLKSTEKTGHELSKGFYVLIISSRKDYAGKLFISYGLGASSISKEEALSRAIEHLKEFDWGYDEKYGYAIEREGEIENFYPTEEE
jgi:hypothetical protein